MRRRSLWERPGHPGSVVAWTLWLVCVLLTTAGVAFAVSDGGVATPVTFASRDASTVQALVYLVLPTLGALIVSRHPRQVIGWLLLVVGATMAVWIAADGWALHALLVAPGSLPAGAAAAWVANGVWAIGWGGVAFLFLLFPDGRPPAPRRRSRWLAAYGVAATAAAVIVLGAAPGPLVKYPWLANPLTRGARPVTTAAVVEAVATWPLILFGVLALAVLVRRTRRAEGVARQQLVVLAVTAGSVVALIAAWSVLAPLGVHAERLEEFSLIAQAAVPVSAGVVVLRHRLYDVRLIVNRTLAYTLTTILLAGVYGLAVMALGRLLDPLTGSSQLAVAASTLSTATLIRPAHSRVQRAVDRRFDRRRYDAALAIEGYRVDVRDQLDLDAVVDGLLGTVRTTLEPTAVDLWLRPEVTARTQGPRPR